MTGSPAKSAARPQTWYQDAVAGYVRELAETLEMLDSRYDEIKSGKVKLIPGEEAFASLHELIDARRKGS